MSAALVYAPKGVRKVFALETYYVGVYSDAKCTKKVTSISWGELSPGSVGKTNVFVRNEELTPSCYMALSTGDWIPLAASGYLMLSWNYDGREIALGEAIPTTLTLKVSEDIHGITDFSFNITIFGTEYNLGDINHDGVVNIYDMVKVAGAYNSTPSASNWNPEADLNGDGIINIYDVTILSQYYGFAS